MESTEIKARLWPVLDEVFGVDQDRIELSSNLSKDLYADSLDIMDLGFRIEKEFKLENFIDDFEYHISNEFDGRPEELTVENIFNFLEKSLQEQTV